MKSKKAETKATTITAEEFDRIFDEGEDIEDHLDHSKAWRPGIAELARNARAATGLSQAVFAECYGIPFSTLRDWEHGKRVPDAAARNDLRVIARIPDIVAKALTDAAWLMDITMSAAEGVSVKLTLLMHEARSDDRQRLDRQRTS